MPHILGDLVRSGHVGQEAIGNSHDHGSTPCRESKTNHFFHQHQRITISLSSVGQSVFYLCV